MITLGSEWPSFCDPKRKNFKGKSENIISTSN